MVYVVVLRNKFVILRLIYNQENQLLFNNFVL